MPFSKTKYASSLLFFSLTFVLFFGNCGKKNQTSNDADLVNTAHLDALYEEVRLENGETVGIIHIYSEYPDYKWVGDEDEGVACVDDAARAMVFYFKNYQKKSDRESLRKARMLLKFLLQMQAANGYFHNFIWQDGRINKDGRTSRAEPNWWSWRAFWAYSEAMATLPGKDELRQAVKKSRQALLNVLLKDFSESDSTVEIEGLTLPLWLPYKTSADQAALLLLGLTPIYLETQDSAIEHYIRRLAKGICLMQVENGGDFPEGAFLSWENLWHAYGNSQAYALLVAGEALKDTNLVNRALKEPDFFYPQLLAKGGLNHFKLKKEAGQTEVFEEEQFSQIAYGIRPMVWACTKAGEMTGKEKYFQQAQALSRWFLGENPAAAILYDTKTGRGYDGIISPSKLNRNAGAESTIEALLTLQALEIGR